MSRYMVYAALPIVMGSIGCATTPDRGSVTALVVQRADFLEPEVPYLTSDVIRVNVSYDDVEWIAFVGPNPGQDVAAEVTLTQGSAPALLIMRGWVYISGKWPTGKTRRVTAGGTGTTILVQHEGPADGGTHRAFYLKGNLLTHVRVTLDTDPGNPQTLDWPGNYFEIGPNDQQIPPKIAVGDASPEVRDFLDYVNSAVETASQD